MKYIKYFLTPILIFSINIESQSNNIGEVDLGNVSHSDAFNHIKKMVGEWKGKLHQPNGTIVDTYSNFKLVSNGNTIIETLIEDGVEMVTTYSDKDGELVVKHYCALGTEPMFAVASLDGNSLKLKSDPTPGYHPAHHNYVESIGWTFDSTDSNKVRVDASLHLDGVLQDQYSLIERVN